jgi:two-component system sensor histidine kinase/response regulator
MAFLLGICGSAPAQLKETERLRTTIRRLDQGRDPAPDTAYADTLDLLARAYYGIDADSAFLFGRKALEFAGRTGYRKGEAESWRMLGNTYEMVGDYVNMLSCYQQSLTIAEQIGNTTLIAKVNVNFALFYKQQEEYDKAQQLMEKVSEIYRLSGDSVQAAYIANHLADIALRQEQYDQALQYAQRALQVARGIKDGPTIATYNNDVGRILTARGESAAALSHFLESLAYYRGRNERLGTTATNSLVSQVYLQLKDYPRALQYANEALTEARAIRRKPEIQGSARVLADIYEAKGDYRNALRYFKLYKTYSDSLFNDQSRKEILSRAAQYDFEKQAIRLREAEAMKDAGYERQLRKAALQVSITVVAVVVLSLLAFILLRSRAVNRRMNQLLREKNEKIEEQKEELEQQAVQLLLNNQQKDKLFTIVAHDLRGPLNSLKGLMDFLKEKKLSETEISAMMHEMRRNIDHSSDLVGNLLFWASSQLNGIVVVPVLLELDELVQEVFALFAHQAREKNVFLRMEMGSPLVGFADKDMTQVVIRNLVSNAIKFCRSGGIVTVNGCRRAGEIEIIVTDTGIGMPAEALEKIRRRESFTSYGTAREKGTGLGILLCHEFAEANRGRFFVESEWGKGSRCHFTIPAAPNSSSMSV